MTHHGDRQCRTCLHKRRKFSTITRSVENMLTDITQLHITPEDGISQWVCTACLQSIQKFCEFKKMCLDSIKYLKEYKIKDEEREEMPLDIEFMSVELKQEDDSSIDIVITPELDIAEDGKESNVKTIFSCPYCNGPFSNMKVFNNHIHSIHSENKREDYLSTIANSPPLGFIYKNKNADDEYKCSCGNFSATKYSDLLDHFKNHYGDKPINCSLCEFKCANIGLLKTHLKNHNPEKPFSCHICEFACKKKSGLRSHLETHSEEKTHHCKQCPLTFKWASTLSRHKALVHDQKRNHICEVCDKKFFSLSGLRQHMAVHTGEKPHICHLCGQGFSQATNLRTHIRAMHESEEISRRFKCELCDSSFKHLKDLSCHMSRHTGVKEYKCEQCPFLTNSSYSLKIHTLRHSGETRFSCELCEYKCLDKSSLKIHQVIHTGEKNHPCDLCSYSGATQRALKRHKETHSTELKYACPNCSYRTNVKEIFNRHIRKKCPVKREDIDLEDVKDIMPSTFQPEILFSDSQRGMMDDVSQQSL